MHSFASDHAGAVRHRIMQTAQGIHKHPSLWIFKAGWGMFELLVSFLLQKALEETLQVYYPGPTWERAIAYWIATAGLLATYFMLDYYAYVLRHRFEIQDRLKSLPHKGKGMTGMHIINKLKHTDEGDDTLNDEDDHPGFSLFEQNRGANMTVHPEKGILLRPRYELGLVLVIRLVKILGFFVSLTLKDSVEDTIEVYHHNPSHIRASLYWVLSIGSFFLMILGIYKIPVIQQAYANWSRPVVDDTPQNKKLRPANTEPFVPFASVRERKTTLGKARHDQEHDSRTRDRLTALINKPGHVSQREIYEAVQP